MDNGQLTIATEVIPKKNTPEKPLNYHCFSAQCPLKHCLSPLIVRSLSARYPLIVRSWSAQSPVWYLSGTGLEPFVVCSRDRGIKL